MRWELNPLGGGTRLTLWTNIDRRFISMGAAGWHICFDVLDRLLSETPIGRMVGPETMKFDGWQRLNARVRQSSSVLKRQGAHSELELWIRQTHRWVSIAFTVTVIANFVALAQGGGACLRHG